MAKVWRGPRGNGAAPTWLVALVALLATGCRTSTANESAPSDQTDVWFMQHIVPHLLQTTAVELASDRITRPKLARLADTARLEVRDGGVPEVRAMARQMAAELEAQLRQTTMWPRVWAKTGSRSRSD
jgi:uncharacterized protein (DUF305 family)